MQRFVAFAALLACAAAAPGLLLAHETPVVALHSAPVVHAAVPVVGSKTTITKSSQVVNHGTTAVHAVHAAPVVHAIHTPVVHAAPIVHTPVVVKSAPVVAVHSTPVLVKTAPVAIAHSSSVVHHSPIVHHAPVVKTIPLIAVHH